MHVAYLHITICCRCLYLSGGTWPDVVHMCVFAVLQLLACRSHKQWAVTQTLGRVAQMMARHTDNGPCQNNGTSHRQWATPQTVCRPTDNGPSDRQWAVPQTMGRVPQTMGRPTDHGPSYRQLAVPQTMGRETDSGPSGGPLPQTAEEAAGAVLSPCPPASPGPAFGALFQGLAAPLAM